MTHRPLSILAGLAASLAVAHATLVVNSASPITERITVQIIQVSDDTGASTAPAFGNAGQQAAIFAGIDTIWAQAGIDVEFNLGVTGWNSTFALTGTPGANDPRPTDDLNVIIANAGLDGVLSADLHTINLFLVRIVPGFSRPTTTRATGSRFLMPTASRSGRDRASRHSQTVWM